MLDKCPICGEPRLRFSSGVNHFACGTIGPYIKDGEEEYETGHTCDIHVYSRLFTQMEKERDALTARLAEAEALLKEAVEYDEVELPDDWYARAAKLCGLRVITGNVAKAGGCDAK